VLSREKILAGSELLKALIELEDLVGGVAERAGAGGTGGAEAGAEGGSLDEFGEGLGEGLGVGRGHEAAAVVGEDLQGAAESGGDDGAAGIEGFDEDDTEGFGAEVGLAIEVGGGHELGDVGAFAEELDFGENSGALSVGLEFGEVTALFVGLGAAGDPANPIGAGGDLREGVEEESVAFPRFDAGGDQEDGVMGVSAEGFAEVQAFFGGESGWGRDRIMEDLARGIGEQGLGEVGGVAAIDQDEVGVRFLGPTVHAGQRGTGAVNPGDGG